MKEIRIPVSEFTEDQIAEVTVNIGGNKSKYEFSVESFPWKKEDTQSNDDFITQSLSKIYSLKEHLESYYKDWELIQIFTPDENAKNVQVLFRKRNKS